MLKDYFLLYNIEMNNQEKRLLLNFIGVPNIREAKRQLGVKSFTNEKAYTYINSLYEPVRKQQKLNEVVRRNAIRNLTIQQQQKKRGRQQRSVREFIERRRKRNAFPIADWYKTVLASRKNKMTKPFTLTLNSAVMYGLKREINFNNMYQFQNWLELVEQNQMLEDTGGGGGGQGGVGSEPYEEYQETERGTNESKKNLYRIARLEISDIAGGCNHKKASRGYVKGEYGNIHYFNPTAENNNCGLACLAHILQKKLNYTEIRKNNNLKKGELIEPELLKIIFYDNGGSTFLNIIDKDFSCEFKDNYSYILYEKNHFKVAEKIENTVVDFIEDPNGKKKHTKVRRRLLAYDFETRIIDPTDCDTNPYRIKTGKSYRYLMKDSICSIHYETKTGVETKTFTTNNDRSSAEQFKDFLCKEHRANRHYTVVAHNGARFDNLILQATMTQSEMLHADFQYRGYSLIGMTFYNHIFRDPACFLVGSLDRLCKNFKVVNAKKTTDIYNGMNNTELCFYKPELTLNEFLDLKNTEPEYWNEYIDYCEVDCISLMELWKKFVFETTNLIQKCGAYTRKDGTVNDGAWILKKCSVIAKTTIGGLAKKVIDTLNPVEGNSKFNPMEDYLKFINGEEDKYNYVCKFKRGGISHCNQAGKHNESVAGIDITSQYPTALKYMKIPSGDSNWVKEYNPDAYGYYTIKNLKWDNDRKFRPICASNDRKNGESLNWTTDWETDTTTFVDSELLKYCIKYLGLVDFEVVEGLVSKYYMKGQTLFGKYVDTFFEEKARQDTLKGTPDFNNAYREVCKLFMNSLTGKLVEDPSSYFQLKYSLTPANKKDNINGLGFEKDQEELKMNIWVNAGVMVYSYSKRILWEYIRPLPNQSNDIIHIETDGLYFPAKHIPTLREKLKPEKYTGDYKEVIGFGSDLGNVKVEHISKGASYWLGKKFYYMNCSLENEEVIKIKGVPTHTIDTKGTKSQIVHLIDYETVYAGESIPKEFSTIYKRVYGKMEMSSLRMVRNLNPNTHYEEYN